MPLNNDKGIFIYGFSDEQRELLKNLLEKMGYPKFTIIESSMAKMKIKDIIKGLKFPVATKDFPKEDVVIFNSFSDEELDKVIFFIRNSLELSPIMAVITPTSIEWTFEVLLKHLIEEREWYKTHN